VSTEGIVMFTARTIDNQKVGPIYKAICFCENCGSRVYSKCVTPGKKYIYNPHFAHPHGAMCDDWYEPMSEWHYKWQEQVPIQQREVSIEHGIVRHIADIYLPLSDIVVELQKSNIPINIKHSRDSFYNQIFWLVHDSIKTMGWITTSEKPIFVDLLDGTIRTPFGQTITKEQFISDILLNPNLDYDDWIFGVKGDIIFTRHGKKTKDEVIKGDHLVFLQESGFISQCLLCKNPHPQHCDMTELIHINTEPHFQCRFCGRIYSAYPLHYDPRGDDEVRDKKLAYKQNDPHFGKNLNRIREKTKQNRLNIKREPLIKSGISNDHSITLQNGTLHCNCGAI
jgi:hypothetical protein